MLSLTFGEQVKIVLSRKGMTIKELAEQIEERTGKKMSRQNLTQRLGRDNFQEQDMRMIADILGCSFQLSILASVEAEKASVIEEVPPTSKELDKLAAKKEKKAARVEAKEAEREITVGEIVDMIATHGESEPVEEAVEEVQNETETFTEQTSSDVADEAQEAMKAEMTETSEEVQEESAKPADEAVEEAAQEEEPADVSEEPVPEPQEEFFPVYEETVAESSGEAGQEDEKPVEEPVKAKAEVVKEEPKTEHKSSPFSKISKIISTPRRDDRHHDRKDFQPIKKRADEDEDLVNGDVNPYTGHEYQTNSVRMHPKRIGYVQVYDRKDHKWTDMTEWAFLGFEERKKASLGKDYEPPIYLD